MDDKSFFEDIQEVIARAKQAKVVHIITNGINFDTNRKALDLAMTYDIMEAALGIYPTHVLKEEIKAAGHDFTFSDFDVDEEIEFIRKNKDNIVAVGEVGLDFHWTKEGMDVQKALFQKMINLAEEIKKPIIVHSRKAELECVEMLESSSIKKVLLHCFCGRKSLAKRAAENGWYFSIPCNVARSSQFQMLVNNVNINQILTETDAPGLSPVPGQRNEPSNIIEAVKEIAKLKGFTVEETTGNIYSNYQKLFG